ncbi:MAG: enoyl-CoA hydratase/isomerase family protein [Proteobacteria bacterium]|nr:enoyl-CoA hydratase/isomerase family protein [Pseudomonadota bacterium]
MGHSFKTILVELDKKGILHIILNRADKLNALNALVLEELQQVFTEAKKNSDIKALLITGSGKAFCAGADIKELAEANGHLGLDFAKRGQQVFRELETLGKPSLAAVNGYAFGGGCELAMSATMRIASEKAQFGQPEVKLGVIPGYGGTQRLARLVGKGRALDLCITGRSITAELALQWGLVTELTNADHLLMRAEEILSGIIAMAPLAVKAVIEVIDVGFDLPLPEALQLEALHFGNTCSTEDKREGTEAFLEKRAANFKGE